MVIWVETKWCSLAILNYRRVYTHVLPYCLKRCDYNIPNHANCAYMVILARVEFGTFGHSKGHVFFLVLPSLSQNNVTGGKCWHRGFPYCCHTFHYCFLTLCKSLNFVRYPLAIEHALLENLYLYMCFLLKSICFGDFLAFITLKGTYIVAPWCGRPLWKIAPTSIEFANPITTMKNTSVDALD